MSIQINAEQVASLQELKRERDLARIGEQLALAFPEVAARGGERYGLLIQHGMQRGAAWGLLHAVCITRYLACWFMLGAEFEAKPEYAWAKQILADGRRSQGSKAFQLCRRTREELARMGNPNLPSGESFAAALLALDAAVMPRGEIGSLLQPQRIQLGDPCDLDALELRWLEPALQQYSVANGMWQRGPVAHAPEPVQLAAGAKDARLPPLLHLLAPARSGARLRLRTHAAHCCDARLHPLITLAGPQGLAEWRGPLAADVGLNLLAEPLPPSLPIAVETSARLSSLQFAACGMRESGPALGEPATQIAVYPADQELLHWLREPAKPPRVRAERDGAPLDTIFWQAGLAELDQKLADGLARLATAWERESGVAGANMQAEPLAMAGAAGLSWGWAAHPQGLATPPYFRLKVALDLMAFQLNLRLSGLIALSGAQARLELHCGARVPLQYGFERSPADEDPAALLTPCKTEFRHPFVLALEPVATPELAMLDLAAPASGALVGSAGLRPHPAGAGLQWFLKVEIEAAQMQLHLHDPVLGQQRFARPLLPAMTLIDWSLG